MESRGLGGPGRGARRGGREQLSAQWAAASSAWPWTSTFCDVCPFPLTEKAKGPTTPVVVCAVLDFLVCVTQNLAHRDEMNVTNERRGPIYIVAPFIFY